MLHEHSSSHVLAAFGLNCSLGTCVKLVGDMASLQALEAELQEIKKRKASMQAEAARQAKKAKQDRGEGHVARLLHQAGVDNVPPKLSKAVAAQLLVVLELAGFCTDVVVSWVLGQGRQEKCGKHGLEVWDADARR